MRKKFVRAKGATGKDRKRLIAALKDFAAKMRFEAEMPQYRHKRDELIRCAEIIERRFKR